MIPDKIYTANDWADSSFTLGLDWGSYNARNLICKPYEGDDNEVSATEPWEVSTAFIRNDTIKSPWELGAIHRGKKWQDNQSEKI